MWLTSIMKNMDVAVYNTIVNVLNLGSVGNAYLGTLTNGGVGLAPYHDNESLVPAELTAAIEQLSGGHHRRRRPRCLPGSSGGVAEGVVLRLSGSPRPRRGDPSLAAAASLGGAVPVV